jgi:hypothetical protein
MFTCFRILLVRPDFVQGAVNALKQSHHDGLDSKLGFGSEVANQKAAGSLLLWPGTGVALLNETEEQLLKHRPALAVRVPPRGFEPRF